MGVKWTCAFLILVGMAYTSTEAVSPSEKISQIRDQMSRAKREVKHESGGDGKGGQFHKVTSSSDDGDSASTSSTWSNGGSSGSSSSSGSGFAFGGIGSRGGFGNSEGGSPFPGPGFDFSQFSRPPQSWGFGGNQPGTFPGQGYQFPAGGVGNFGPQNVGSYPYYPNQNSHFLNQPPNFNYQEFIQQPFNQRHNHPNRGPYQPTNTWAHAAAFMTSPNGGVPPNEKASSYSWSSTSTSGSNQGAGDSSQAHTAANREVNGGERFYGQNNGLGNGFPYNNYFPNDFANRGGFDNEFGNFGSFNQRFPYSSGAFPNMMGHHPNAGHGAFAQAHFGPQGGFQRGFISPDVPGVESRFFEDFPAPPPGSKTFGTYTHSSSKSYRGPDGKETVEKIAEAAVNDNGRVRYKSVHYP